jgi:Family of unknown function (DUF6525)
MTQPTPEEEMRAYDRLPKTLRKALCDSGEQFSALQLFKLWRTGKPCVELVAMVKQEDRWR